MSPVAVARVKICGLCTPEDAAAAVAAGADYVGVVLVPGRTRTRSVAEAATIFAAAGGALRVGVFAGAQAEEVLQASRALQLDVVQLHGPATPVELVKLRSLGAPAIWKAVRVEAAASARTAFESYGAVADAVLLDGADGGRGVRFDWPAVRPLRSRLPRGVRLVVAGGLNPANVAEAIAQLAPDVVDVSSGVESAPGRKSAALVRAFIAAVHGAETG